MQENYFENEYHQSNYNAEQVNNFSSYKDIPKIRVVVRKRPLNKKELMKNDLDIIEQRGPHNLVVKELK